MGFHTVEVLLRLSVCSVVTMVSVRSATAVQNTSAFSTKVMALLKSRGFRINEKLDAKAVPVFGRSLLANSEVYDDEYLAESEAVYDITQVPRELLEHRGLRKWTQDDEVVRICDKFCRRDVIMALGLIYSARKEKVKEGSTFWGAYALEMYPQSEDSFNNLLSFDSEMIKDLLVTSASDTVQHLENYLRVSKLLLKKFDGSNDNHQDIFTELDGKPAPTLDDVFVYFGTLRSRSFHLGYHPPILVAGLDAIVNHHVDMNQCAWFESPDDEGEFVPEPASAGVIPDDMTPKRQRFAFRAGGTYTPGTHVYHFYNDHGSMQLLTTYGFIRPPDAPKIADIGALQFEAPAWAVASESSERGAKVWEELCSSSDAETEGKFSEAFQAAWPEGNLLCLRASSYKSAFAAKKAFLSGWLVKWQGAQQQHWSAEKRVNAFWVKNDAVWYNQALRMCSDKLDTIHDTASKWQTWMSMHDEALDTSQRQTQKSISAKSVQDPALGSFPAEYLELTRGLQAGEEYVASTSLRRQFAVAILEEKSLLERCVTSLTERLDDLKKIQECCVKTAKKNEL